MPFKSEAQRKLCFSLQSKEKAKGWDCKKWNAETPHKNLPQKVKQSSKKSK